MISQIEILISVFGVLAMCLVRIIAWRYVTVRATTVRQFARTDAAREKALRESEHRFQEFAASASDWMWEMNKEFKFTYFSNVNSKPRLLNLIGKTRWEVAGIDPEADEHWGNINEYWRPASHFEILRNGIAPRIPISGMWFPPVGRYLIRTVCSKVIGARPTTAQKKTH